MFVRIRNTVFLCRRIGVDAAGHIRRQKFVKNIRTNIVIEKSTYIVYTEKDGKQAFVVMEYIIYE